MKIQGDKKAVVAALTRVASVANPKSTMPVMANVLIVPDPAGVQLVATDLQVSAIATVGADVGGVDGDGESVCVSARDLLGIVKALPGDKLTIETVDHDVIVKAGRSRFKLPTIAGAEFPKVRRGESSEFATVRADALCRALDMTRYALAADDRPHMAGVQMTATGNTITARATDSLRASRAVVSDVGNVGEWDCFIPARAVSELRSAAGGCESVDIAVDGGWMFVRSDACDLSMLLSNEKFPPLDKIVGHAESAAKSLAVVPRQAMIDGIKRVALVAESRNGAAVLAMRLSSDSLCIHGESSGVGEGTDEMTCSYDGPVADVRFAPRFMLDALASVPDDNAHIHIGGQLDPILVRSDSSAVFHGIVMPVRPVAV